MENEIKVTIEGAGLHFIDHTTKQKAGQIISFLGLGAGMPTSDSGSGQVLPRNQQTLLISKITPKETLDASGAKTYPQKIVAVAAHLKEYEGKEQFRPQEVRLALKKIGDEPKNFGRDLGVAIELKYLIVIDSKEDVYEVTERGVSAVKDGFPPVQVKKVGQFGKRVKQSRGIREEVSRLDISTSIEGFPGFHQVKKKGDQILWVLQFALINGVDRLTPPEVDFLSDKMRSRIEARAFSALIAGSMKKSYVKTSTSGVKLEQKGTDYLKSLVAE